MEVKNKKFILKKILNILIFIIIVSNVCQFVIGEDIINIFGYKFFISEYANSEPKISKGDVIIVDSKKEINKGDTVVFFKADKLITHKIDEKINNKYGDEYKTKGVDNITQDVWTLKKEDIEGVYKYRFFKFGYLIKLLTNKIILIISVVFVLIQIKLKRKKISKSRRRKLKRLEGR